MKKVTVSSSAKLHLSGEHAVVYGNPAVLVSTSKRLYVTISRDPFAKSMVLSELIATDPYVGHIVQTFQTHMGQVVSTDIHIGIVSDVPIKAGMGSSAAFAVSFVGALMAFYEKEWSVQKINEVAFLAEGFIHTNSSGGDTAIVTHGGLLWYRKELDYLKTFWLLSYKVPKSFPPMILIHTGRTESTGDLVSLVGKKREAKPQEFIQTLWEFQLVTKDMVAAIHDENESLFIDTVKKNEMLLEKLGVVSVSTKKLIREIESLGGVAKISGAGGVMTGSGTVLVVHKDPSVIEKIAKKYAYPFSQVVLSGIGVRLEQAVA